MELALQVVGLKMTGKIEDARDVAMRIVNTTGPDNMGSTPGGGHPGTMQLATSAPAPTADMRNLLLARAGAGESGDFEQLMLDFLRVLDTPPFAAAPTPARLGRVGTPGLHLQLPRRRPGADADGRARDSRADADPGRPGRRPRGDVHDHALRRATDAAGGRDLSA